MKVSPNDFTVEKINQQLLNLQREVDLIVKTVHDMETERIRLVTVQAGNSLDRAVEKAGVFARSVHKAFGVAKKIRDKVTMESLDPPGPESEKQGPKYRKKQH